MVINRAEVGRFVGFLSKKQIAKIFRDNRRKGRYMDPLMEQLASLTTIGKPKLKKKINYYDYFLRRLPKRHFKFRKLTSGWKDYKKPFAPYKKAKYGPIIKSLFGSTHGIDDVNYHTLLSAFIKANLSNMVRSFSRNFFKAFPQVRPVNNLANTSVDLITIKKTRQLKATTILKYYLYRLKKYHTPRQISYQLLNRLVVKSPRFNVARKLNYLRLRSFRRLVGSRRRRKYKVNLGYKIPIKPKPPAPQLGLHPYRRKPNPNLIVVQKTYKLKPLHKLTGAAKVIVKLKRKYESRVSKPRYKINVPSVKNQLAGLSLKCSGRFNRQQMASSVLLRRGSVSASSLWLRVDYAKGVIPLKYGAVGVKVYATHTYAQ